MMSLENWRQNGWLAARPSSLAEMTQLFAVVDREVSDANSVGMSVDGRFMHAYDAALILCKAALRAHGFSVVKGSGHHKRLIESLVLTLGEGFREVSDQIEYASRRRGQAMYDAIDVVDSEDAEELLATVATLRSSLLTHLRNNFAELVPPGEVY